MFIYTSIKIPTRANNARGNARASIIFMGATWNGEHIFNVRCFHVEEYFLPHPFFFPSLCLTVLPSSCHLMLSVEAVLGIVSRLSRCCFWWRIDNNYLGTSLFFSRCISCPHPPFFLRIVGHETQFVAVVCITPLILLWCSVRGWEVWAWRDYARAVHV